MCIGVETHDLAPPRHDRGWVAGGFGHNRLKYDDAKVRELRVVQVGWAIGDVSSYAPPVTKSRIVKPNDFFITSAATKIHGIKHTDAVEKGDDLEDVLAETLKELRDLAGRGGWLCAVGSTGNGVASGERTCTTACAQ